MTHVTARSLLRPFVILVLLVGVFVIGAPVALRLSVAPHIYTSAVDVPEADAAIVLGASVVRGQPSPVLAERANAAIKLYQAGKAPAILVTGDSQDTTHDEVTPVRKYLEAAGVRPTAIFLDREGYDTYTSMYRAKTVFGARRAVIVTQDFHLPRAIFVARSLGIEASGYVAPGTERSPYDYLREIPASVKAIWDVATGRVPSDAGTLIPLDGDGTGTW